MGSLAGVCREVDAVLRFLKHQCGAQQVGVVGFCWGGVATHYIALQYPEVTAGVSFYGTSAITGPQSAASLEDLCNFLFFGDAMQELSVKERTGMRSRAQSSSSLLKMMIIFPRSRSVCRTPDFGWQKGICNFSLFACC